MNKKTKAAKSNKVHGKGFGTGSNLNKNDEIVDYERILVGNSVSIGRSRTSGLATFNKFLSKTNMNTFDNLLESELCQVSYLLMLCIIHYVYIYTYYFTV